MIAGAGTGKTHTMVTKVNRLLDTGTEPGRIAVVTFTRKAAAEIRGRLRRRTVTVGTIHHLAREVWRRTGRARRPLSQMDDGPRRVRQIGAWIAHECREDPELMLELETRREALRRAGAGSHAPIALPTLTIARVAIALRMLGLHATGAEGRLVAWLPGTGPAKRRYVHCEDAGGDVRLSAPALRMWQREGRTLERIAERIAPAFDTTPDELKGMRTTGRDPKNTRNGTTNEWLALIGEVKAWMDVIRTTPDIDRAAERSGVGAMGVACLGQRMIQRYERALEREGATDHDGHVLGGIEVAGEEDFRNPWDWILVDEYQDVNPAQETFIHTLANARREGGGGPVRIWCVGDDWQAIFGFQNASVELMRGFCERHREATVHRLEQTYRFGQALADAAGSIVESLDAGLEKRIRGRETDPGAEPGASVRIVSTDLTAIGTAQYREEHNATGAILAVLDEIATMPNAEDVLIISRNNASVEDSTEALLTRTERTVRRWTRDPHTAPNGIFEQSEDEMWAKAMEIAMVETRGLMHKRVKDQARRRELKVRLDVQTVHGAKGLEARDVIIVDPGLPDTPADRAIRMREATLDLFRVHPYELDKEEARIWYVAITRAKSRCWIVVRGGGHPASPQVRTLVEESRKRGLSVLENAIPKHCGGYLDPVPCPQCARGYLNVIHGTLDSWVRCSRHPRCRYREDTCRDCMRGLLRPSGSGWVCSRASCSKDDW